VTQHAFCGNPRAPSLTECLPRARSGRRPPRWYIRSVVNAGLGRALGIFLTGVAAALVLAGAAASAPSGSKVLVVEFDNDVNPVTQDYLVDEMRRGESEGYNAVVIEMDTPGGLGSSMRAIVKEMLAVKVPVVVYVAPSGSSADSAGAVIGQAADILAMAPQTNIGSSTPITSTGDNFGSDLRKKVVNDAAAYIGELAREHGRNVEKSEAMVRDAANYGAREALDLGIVDVMAPSVPALLEQIDGRTTVPKGLVLQTADAQVERVEMSFWKRALDLLIDPNVIALMLSVGLLGIVVELWNPGLILPGTVGAISLIIGLYGLQVLPVSVAGVLMMLLGALLLFDPAGDLYQVSLWTAVAIAGSLAVLMGVALSRVAKARRNPVEVGVTQLVGDEAVVRREGWVAVGGELWRARRPDGRPLVPGEHVTVESVEDGLELVVGSSNPTERA
jgi:membrane-bound serine protease (ClpP class)